MVYSGPRQTSSLPPHQRPNTFRFQFTEGGTLLPLGEARPSISGTHHYPPSHRGLRIPCLEVLGISFLHRLRYIRQLARFTS
jgi:hypothetical protein